MTTAKYIIFVDEKMLCADVEPHDCAYLQKVLPHLQPMSDEEYMNGPAAILNSLARFSYVLLEDDLLWCIEWEPGFVILRFSRDGKIAAAALRSPIPNFGGRKPDPEDERDYDEDAENHQYNLVFHAWDSQFDEQWRKWRSFKKANKNIAEQFEACLEHVQTLGGQLEQTYAGSQAATSKWLSKCQRNIKKWAKQGLRIK